MLRSRWGVSKARSSTAIDAPWRIEPVVDASGNSNYGAIPIVLTVLDENVIPWDADGSSRLIGNFCELEVKHGAVGRHISFKNLAEVEATGYW